MLGLAGMPILTSCNRFKMEMEFAQDTKAAVDTTRWLNLHIVRQIEFFGCPNDTKYDDYDVSYCFDKNKNRVYFISDDSLQLHLITCDSVSCIDFESRNIENYKQERYVFGCRSNCIGWHTPLNYNVLLPKEMTMPVPASVYQKLDTIMGDGQVRKYASCGPKIMKYNRETGEYDIEGYQDINFWLNRNNHLLDSVVAIDYLTSPDEFQTKITYRVLATTFDDKSQFFDSIFDFKANSYNEFLYIDDDNFRPVAAANTPINPELFSFEMKSLDLSVSFLNDYDSWLLLDLWQFRCPSCIDQLKAYKHEQDSLGYRILEHEGIRIFAINYISDNMELIGKVADKTGTTDIIYSAKGLNTIVSLPTLGYYYLLSPDKEIVYESSSLGDYSELLKAKEAYEKKHANK